jgi:hypothetical protein
MKRVPHNTDLFFVNVALVVMRYAAGADSCVAVRKYNIFEASVC